VNETDLTQHRHGALLVVPARLRGAQREHEVVERGQVPEEAVVLEDHADAAPQQR